MRTYRGSTGKPGAGIPAFPLTHVAVIPMISNKERSEDHDNGRRIDKAELG